jgi:large subunit ribosomal protein L10
MLKTDKPQFVADLTTELKDVTSLVAIDYSGLTVKLQQELKKALKTVNARMLVVKNRLLTRAYDPLKDTVIEGPTAIITTKEDPIAPLQVLAKFAKEHELLNFKVGVVDGLMQDAATLTTLSKLASKQVLYAQVVGAVASPLYGLVSVLQANSQKLIYILKSKAGDFK